MLTTVFAAAALLQYGSCQSSGPDRSRTAAEAAEAYVQGVAARDPGAIRWVTRPGTLWRSPTETMTDAEFYERLQPSDLPNQHLVITGLIGTARQVAIASRVKGIEGSEALTMLTVEDGCIVNVQLF